MSNQEAAMRKTQSERDTAMGKQVYRRWVSDKFLAEYYEVSRITIWNWARAGKLPAPKKIGENTTRWDFEAIQSNENAA